MLLICLGLPWFDPKPAQATEAAEAGSPETIAFELDLQPFLPRKEFPGAFHLTVALDGWCEGINYSPYGLIVHSRRSGRMSPIRVQQWRERLTDEAFLRLNLPNESRVTEGDLYEFRGLPASGSMRLAAGNLSHAAPRLKTLIEELLQATLEKDLATPPPGYLRIQPASSRVSGGPSPRVLNSLPDELRAVLLETFGSGRKFVAMEAKLLQEAQSLGQQFLISHEARTYEVTCFTTVAKAETQPKRP